MKIATDMAGIQRLQRDNLSIMASLKPGGSLGRAVKWATMGVHRYAVRITHVDTGALRGSHQMSFREGHGEAEGLVDISRATRNPKHGIPPFQYGPIEHARGASHAFYERTYREAGPSIIARAGSMYRGSLPR